MCGVAFEFELAPKGVELRKSRVADAARHAHLARVARHRMRGLRHHHCHRRQNDASNPDSVLRHGRTSLLEQAALQAQHPAAAARPKYAQVEELFRKTLTRWRLVDCRAAE